MVAFCRRHRIFCVITVTIFTTYTLWRLFCTPPLLSGIDFSNAYYDRHGRLMRITLSADDKYRIYTPLHDINPALQRATVLYEDKYFHYHPGINPVALARAAKNYWRGALHPAGASTITMQVARIKYNLDTTHPTGKLIQIAAAIYIDAFYSKSEILEAYLNLAPYGGNIEGIGAASQIYFHATAADISTIEAITLSTIPQNPTKRGLNTTAGMQSMHDMRIDLVRRWIAKYPSESYMETLAQMPLNAYGVRDLPFDAPHFINRMVSRTTQKPGAPHPRIITTLDMGLQNALGARLKSEVARRHSIGIQNAAAILINYQTMDTLAYIGSADYFNKSIYGENDGVAARRSPGSTLKPLIYAAAVDRGLIHGMTLLKDAKINFGVYAPENSDSEFYGPVLARDALTHSRNIPAINLLRRVGVRNFYKLLTECGVTGLKSPSHYGISIALGGAEVSMHELAEIYATIANLGVHYDIRTQMEESRQGGKQLLSPEAFFIVLDMLAHQATPIKNIPFAKARPTPLRHYWKTGTSSSYRDAWTAGIFGDYVLIVWVGNFDGRPNNAFSGARAAAPIYFALADAVREYMQAQNIAIANNNFMRPELNISQIDMCADVGGIAGAHCPKTIKSYFIPGVSPIDVAPVYRAIPIDIRTGLRACRPDPDTTRMAVYEFWDPEYLDMFRRAGIRRNTPPRYMENCKLNDISAARRQPIITTPADGTKIVIIDAADTAPVPFSAIADDNDTKIFWFLDDNMIGTSKSGDTINATVKMGEHTVRAVDEMGAGTSADFIIVK